MKTYVWMIFIAVAFAAGLLVGYGAWGTKAGEVATLTEQVADLRKENEDLKRELTAAREEAAPPETYQNLAWDEIWPLPAGVE